MRVVDDRAIAAAAAVRFRSEYHYALFEYLRSAKVLAALEKAGVALHGRVLDDGCGGGGILLSVAEEARLAVGLDIRSRFVDSGTRLAAERSIRNAVFLEGDGTQLPFGEAVFDLVLSHSVIEHVSSAQAYLRECRRVLKPGGVLYLSTAPYLSLAGAHLPRLVVPIPLHILAGRRLAFRFFCWLGRHAPWALQEARDANTFVSLAADGKRKHDDLLQRVTVRSLEQWIDIAGLKRRSMEHHVTGFFRRLLPERLRQALARTPIIQDVMIGHIQCVLEKA